MPHTSAGLAAAPLPLSRECAAGNHDGCDPADEQRFVRGQTVGPPCGCSHHDDPHIPVPGYAAAHGLD